MQLPAQHDLLSSASITPLFQREGMHLDVIVGASHKQQRTRRRNSDGVHRAHPAFKLPAQLLRPTRTPDVHIQHTYRSGAMSALMCCMPTCAGVARGDGRADACASCASERSVTQHRLKDAPSSSSSLRLKQRAQRRHDIAMVA